MKKIFTLLLLLCSYTLFSQTIYYVKPTGNDANSGTSWLNAFRTLQKAINTISTGEIWVAAGTYYPDEGPGLVNNAQTYSFTLRDNLAIYGGFAGNEPDREARNWFKNETILSGDIDQVPGNGGNAYHVLYSKDQHNTAVIDGFTIRDGNANGPGLGDYDVGGGMYNTFSTPTIRNCFFTHNTHDPNSNIFGGGAIFNYFFCDAQIINCRFTDNSSPGQGGAVNNYYSSPFFANCIFNRNSANSGGAIYNEYLSAPSIVNCTIYENTAVDGPAICDVRGSSFNMINTIVWGHTNWLSHDMSGLWAKNPSISYSIVQGGAVGTGNLNMQPAFVQPDLGDFHLTANSPAIDHGTSSWAPLFDMENFKRPFLNGYDIGAHEYYPPVLYVKYDASGPGNNGTSWENAFRSLQDAIKYAEDYPMPVSLWVAKGTYYPDEGAGLTDNDRTLSFRLRSHVALYGGFSGYESALSQRHWRKYETILSGNIERFESINGNSYHVVTGNNTDTTAILDGFTIMDGNADNQQSSEDGDGGGISLSGASPKIANLIIKQNHAVYRGGGIYSHGAYNSSVTNCIFWKNTAQTGGGFYSYNAVWNFNHCSFSNNSTAITAINNSPFIRNCVLWGNGTELQALGSSPQVRNSIIRGGYYPGTNIINADPLFTDTASGDLHLKVCSPAIDKGNNSDATAEYDLDKNGRIINFITDMGAYEFQGTIIYVNDDATGINNGTSWQNAFRYLQDAITAASQVPCSSFVMIWVAPGIYYPDLGSGQVINSRKASFHLRNNLAIMGGFAGNETVLGDRLLYTVTHNNLATLSGEIDAVLGNSGNSLHVVTASGVNHTAVLEGFTITGGNANGADTDGLGGGLLNANGSSATINYCHFTANAATTGGAVGNTGSSPSIFNSIFRANKATYGGGIYNNVSNAVLINDVFWKNSAASRGGGIYNTSSPVTIVNGTFNGNTGTAGAGIANISSNATITNSIFWGNSSGQIYNSSSTPLVTYCDVQGGYSGTGNKNVDPQFKDAINGDLSLSNGSPVINKGNNAVVTLSTDVLGLQRILFDTVDLGAYENNGGSTAGPAQLMINCPGNITLKSKADSCGTTVFFTGTEAATTTGGVEPVTIMYEPAAGSFIPVGDVLVTVTAMDSLEFSRSCSFWLTVADSTAPVISNVSLNNPVLYPPNHKMWDIELFYTATDNCGAVNTNISVTSNEPEYGSGSGDMGPDWQVINNHKVKLRSERSGSGSDRIYTITITATDAAGNTATATTTVTVPHDKGSVTSARAVTTKEAGSLVVTAVPNPSSEGFTLYTQSPSTLPLSIRVMDGAGRMIESRKGVVANGTLYFGNNYRPGVYYVQVMQGDVLQTIKLVKQNR